MKKILLLALCCYSFGALGQLPYVESFETGSGYTPQIADIIDNLDDYFSRMDTDCSGPPDPCAANFLEGYNGWIGTYYWAGEDHDDAQVGGTGVATLCVTLDPIDISANATGALEIAAYYAGDDRSNAYDPTNDGVSLTYSVDGGGSQTAHLFSYYDNGSGGEFLAYDDDNSGTIDAGEVSVLTETFTRYARVIATSGSSLVITVCAHSNSGSEEWAIDQIEVSGAMPVELSHFSVNTMDEGALLKWTTASEENNEYFAIERSTNGLDFEAIDRVDGQGTSFAANEYTYFDKNLPDSKYIYYRLRQVDFDGSFDHSPVKTIFNQLRTGELRLWPMPTDKQVQLQFAQDMREAIDVQIYDISGQLLRREQLPAGDQHTLNIEELPHGQYLLRAQSGAQSWTKKLIKL
ncbi:MAG: T9SS type A sorting domain-containing protein [Bacteroidota bacterium]